MLIFTVSIKNANIFCKLNNIVTIRITVFIIFGQNWEIPLIVGPFVFWLFLERPLTKMFWPSQNPFTQPIVKFAGVPKVILVKSWPGLFFRFIIWGLGCFGQVGQLWVHEFLVFFYIFWVHSMYFRLINSKWICCTLH